MGKDHHATETATSRLSPGDDAPEFFLADADGANVSLSSYRGQRVVLYAYPAAMTPGCTTEACDFRGNPGALTEAGIAVLGISPDRIERSYYNVEATGDVDRLLRDLGH